MKVKPWWLILPSLVLVGFNSFFPIFYVIYLSTQKYFMTGEAIPPQFVGLFNFQKIVSDLDLWASIAKGALFSVACLAIETLLGMALALVVKDLRGKLGTAISTLICVPMLIPPAAVGVTWMLSFRGWYALFPYLLKSTGIHYNIGNAVHAFLTCVMMDVWHWTGFIFLICLASLSSVPLELIEAAKIDVASSWSMFRRVYLPWMKFPLFVGIIIRFMDVLKIYDEVFILTGGGPGTATRFLSIKTVSVAMAEMNVGYGSSVALFFLYLIIVVTAFLMILLTLDERRKVKA